MNPLNMTWRIVFASLTLAFCAGVVVWTMLYGQTTNSLHTSAQSWAWFMGLIVLGGIGVSAVSQQAIDAFAGLFARK